MRWIHTNTNDAAENQARARVIAAIDAFWRQLTSRLHDLRGLFEGTAKWDVVSWMSALMDAIDPRLAWEFGRGPQGTCVLVITAESHRGLRPLVDAMLARAPEIPGWAFAPYREAGSPEHAAAMVEARTGGSVAGATVRAARGSHHLIDLSFYLPGTDTAEEQHALHQAMVLAEALLGEERLDHWVGLIDAAPLADAPPDAIPLGRLRPTAEALIGAISDQLPDRPYREMDLEHESHKWSMFQLEADEAHDYPQRWDLVTMITAAGDLAEAAHAGPPFASCRYSRCGETFAYLKVDGREPLKDFSDREALEDAVNDTLRAARAGCVIGGGTGLRYSYVDLALTDVGAAIEALRAALPPRQMPERTWLLFFDAELAEEWVGLYDQTPLPPQV